MKLVHFYLGALVIAVLLSVVINKQDNTIKQQRQLIKEMAANPSCLIPLHITEN